MRAWFKLYEGTTDDPKFRLVARLSGCPIAVVIAIWIRLLERACDMMSGEVADDFNCAVSDVALDLEDGTTQRVIARWPRQAS